MESQSNKSQFHNTVKRIKQPKPPVPVQVEVYLTETAKHQFKKTFLNGNVSIFKIVKVRYDGNEHWLELYFNNDFKLEFILSHVYDPVNRYSKNLSKHKLFLNRNVVAIKGGYKMKTIVNAIKELKLESLSMRERVETIINTVNNLDLEYHPKADGRGHFMSSYDGE